MRPLCQTIITPLAIAVALAIAGYVNVAFTPDEYVTSGVFATAIVIAAPAYRPRGIALVGGIAIGAYLWTAWFQDGVPHAVWPVGSLALLIVTTLSMWVANQREIVEQRSREAEDERYRMERLLSLVSHELRGALTPVRGNIQLLQRRASDTRSEREQRTLDTIGEGTERLYRIVHDLTDLHHLHHGALDVQPSPMDLASMMRQVVADVQATTNHRIVIDAPEQLAGTWDSVRLYQIVRNLVSNATKYSPAGTCVRVNLRKRASEAVIEVSDEGEGISQTDQQRLFEPFTRFSDNNSASGMGLGLYITKGIVEAHRGSIMVNSRLGHGTTFVVTLPIHADAAIAERSARQRQVVEQGVVGAAVAQHH